MEQSSTTGELRMTEAGRDKASSSNTEVGPGENPPDRASFDEQASPVQTLAALTSEVRDQEELERDVAQQVHSLPHFEPLLTLLTDPCLTGRSTLCRGSR